MPPQPHAARPRPRPLAALPAAPLLLLLAACAGDAPVVATAAPEPEPPTLRVAKEGGDLGRIDLFHYDPRAGRMARLAHCPEGCAETVAVLPGPDVELEVVATGWPYMRMSGWKNLAPCARSDGGFMSPCRFRVADVPPEGIVAVFFARPGVTLPDQQAGLAAPAPGLATADPS